ncbi:MAG TPA: sigma-70 family RNA polymerase sigma factor, partial [Spirochaetia bacterium]|nr:sigma-70 family RNA polymerase sigma factor [Spirochaetia bacterium]
MEHHRTTAVSHTQDDAQVLKAVQDTLRGDTSAFETIVKKYSSVVYSLAYRMLGNGEDAEEAVQEIFLRLYRSLSRFQLNRQFRPWLYSIAANYLRSLLRKKRRRYAFGSVAFNDAILHKPGMTPSIDPAALIESREAERIATIALQNLRPEH